MPGNAAVQQIDAWYSVRQGRDGAARRIPRRFVLYRVAMVAALNYTQVSPDE